MPARRIRRRGAHAPGAHPILLESTDIPVARIAEMLVVSENTIRTHSKRIYAKLDIHKKQELLVLIDQM